METVLQLGRAMKGGNLSTKLSWEFLCSDGIHILELVTHTVTGRRAAYVDSVLVYDEIINPLKAAQHKIFFTASGRSGELSVDVHDKMKITVTCTMDRVILQDIMSQAALPSEPSLGHFHISVTCTRVEGVTTTQIIVLYKVHVNDGKEAKSSEKRFQDFEDLQQKLLMWYKGSGDVYRKYVPYLPFKEWKMVRNHADPQFIESRRVKLEQFLRKLVLCPRICRNPDVKRFLCIPVSFGSPLLSPVQGIRLPGSLSPLSSPTSASAFSSSVASPSSQLGQASTIHFRVPESYCSSPESPTSTRVDLPPEASPTAQIHLPSFFGSSPQSPSLATSSSQEPQTQQPTSNNFSSPIVSIHSEPKVSGCLSPQASASNSQSFLTSSGVHFHDTLSSQNQPISSSVYVPSPQRYSVSVPEPQETPPSPPTLSRSASELSTVFRSSVAAHSFATPAVLSPALLEF